ncbi:MAG TPA: DUF2179 domain-containing protein [Acholeplasmataceae bacterium]|jgi:uncharacterized protein YebE (UPF0316 family)|nr:DUF2179 domain-containing protein [Acholeplasmataceae bacterium]
MFWALLLEFLIIFFSRVIEVSIGTLRNILVNKGYGKKAALLAFIEALIWVFVASRVIGAISEEPLKAIVYALGFAGGVFTGSILEKRIALGQILVQAITSHESGIKIADILRESGFGVTTAAAEGKEARKMILIVYAKRKNQEIVTQKIYELDPQALIVVQDITSIRGGYISSFRNLIK